MCFFTSFFTCVYYISLFTLYIIIYVFWIRSYINKISEYFEHFFYQGVTSVYQPRLIKKCILLITLNTSKEVICMKLIVHSCYDYHSYNILESKHNS